jgi:hypothetical protein
MYQWRIKGSDKKENPVNSSFPFSSSALKRNLSAKVIALAI